MTTDDAARGAGEAGGFPGPLDPEIAAVLDRVPAIADISDLGRARAERAVLAERNRANRPPVPGVAVEDRRVRGADGHVVGIRLHLPAGARSGAALCWLHGGGHVMGDVAQDDPLLSAVVAATGCVAVSVDWRRSPERPYPAALDDAYAALTWMAGAAELGLDPTRLVVGGASSGGGLAAGLALLARDRAEISPSAQVLIYPMLDDRPRRDAGRAVTDHRVWNEESNRIAWGHYLRAVGDDVPEYAAPSRASDLSGLPPTWMATGALDLFVDEDVDYAQRLMRSGVPVELHVYPGAIHGFDVLAPDATLSLRYAAERDAALERLLTT